MIHTQRTSTRLSRTPEFASSPASAALVTNFAPVGRLPRRGDLFGLIKFHRLASFRSYVNTTNGRAELLLRPLSPPSAQDARSGKKGLSTPVTGARLNCKAIPRDCNAVKSPVQGWENPLRALPGFKVGGDRP
jgi:hypothetical protein